MKRTNRVVLGMLATVAALAAAAPAGAQVVIVGDCMVSGGGQIVAPSADDATFGGSASTARARVGQQVYVDHGPATPLRFRSLVMTAVVCNLDSRRVEMVGTGEVQTPLGPQVVQYEIAMFVAPNGAQVPDTYSITLSNGYESGEQPVVHGNITLHEL